jgi:hypothetical protein
LCLAQLTRIARGKARAGFVERELLASSGAAVNIKFEIAEDLVLQCRFASDKVLD